MSSLPYDLRLLIFFVSAYLLIACLQYLAAAAESDLRRVLACLRRQLRSGSA